MYKKLFSLFSLILIVVSSFAADDLIPSRPNPPRLVNDFANLLSNDEVMALESKLLIFNDSTSNQIVIAIVSDLGDYEKADFATKLANKWGIGQEKLDNGILILLKPKTSFSKGEAFIATGKGLEGAIPDAACYQIVNKEMIPHFKANDYFGGLDAATNVLMSLAKGEYNFDTYNKKREGKIAPILIIVILAVFILISFFRRSSGYSIGRRGYGGGFLGGFGGGGFGGGDSGGGGFGGFGGGSFGGGGSGGSW